MIKHISFVSPVLVSILSLLSACQNGQALETAGPRTMAAQLFDSHGTVTTPESEDDANTLNTLKKACYWIGNDSPAYCIAVMGGQGTPPKELKFFVGELKKGAQPIDVSNYSIEVRVDAGGDDDLVEVHDVTFLGTPMKAIDPAKLPCGNLYLRAQINGTAADPSVKYTGAVMYVNRCETDGGAGGSSSK